MSLIYTHNTSPRRYKKVVKSKSWYKAKEEQNKLLRSMGIDPNRRLKQPRMTVPLEQVGKLKTFENNIKVETIPTYKSSGTRPVSNEKLEVSKQYTIAPAYNKGPSMVVGRKDIKDIGK
tara:strand:- start:256 stop:612 length:357 start_codon:yes stop_codon:yes gene_type:complete